MLTRQDTQLDWRRMLRMSIRLASLHRGMLLYKIQANAYNTDSD